MEISPATFVLGLAISTALSLLVFSHASRHGNKHATAWGVAAFVLGGAGALLYYVRYFLKARSGPRY